MTSVNYRDLLRVRPDTLAQQQHDALKKEVLHRIEAFRAAILRHDYKALQGVETEFSPAGDEMGCDNYYIDWGWGDVEETTKKLAELLSQAGGQDDDD